jgi:hypothetical protein
MNSRHSEVRWIQVIGRGFLYMNIHGALIKLLICTGECKLPE